MTEHKSDCPLSDPETFCNPATAGLPCTCEPETATFWLVGQVQKWRPPMIDGGTSWEFGGLFDTEEKAVAACRDEAYFVAAVRLNEQSPHEQAAAELNGYYPFALMRSKCFCGAKAWRRENAPSRIVCAQCGASSLPERISGQA